VISQIWEAMMTTKLMTCCQQQNYRPLNIAGHSSAVALQLEYSGWKWRF